MSLQNGTGPQTWPLTTGNNDNPDITQGGQVSFFFDSVPDRCPSAPLAYYLPLILLTITGTLTQPASGSNLVFWDKLLSALLTSVQVQNAWHGTVISANHVTGQNLPLVEFLSNGFRRAARQRPPVPDSAGAYPFRYTIGLTPSVSRIGRLEGSTSQLAALFKQAQMVLNFAPSSVISGLSPGATLTSLKCRASAVLVPRNELVLGTPVETIQHQVVAGSNSNQVQIQGFGTESMLTGVQNKGGVVYLGELTDYLGGVFASEDVEFFNFPWRGQGPVYDIDGFVAAQQLANLPVSRSQVFPTNVSGGDSEFTDYPYGSNTDDAWTASETSPKTYANLMAWAMAQAGADLDLTDVQTADSTQSYFLSVDGGFNQGSHLILAQYAKAWQPNMVTDWLRQVTKEGDASLAAYVLGKDKYKSAKFDQRGPRSKHIITDDQLAYLPFQLYLEETARK